MNRHEDEAHVLGKKHKLDIPSDANYVKWEKGVDRLCPICAEVMCSCKRTVNSICESCMNDWDTCVERSRLSNWQNTKRWKELEQMILLGRIQREPIIVR